MKISALASVALSYHVVVPAPAVGGTGLVVRARGAKVVLGNGTTVEFSTSRDNSMDSPPDRLTC